VTSLGRKAISFLLDHRKDYDMFCRVETHRQDAKEAYNIFRKYGFKSAWAEAQPGAVATSSRGGACIMVPSYIDATGPAAVAEGAWAVDGSHYVPGQDWTFMSLRQKGFDIVVI